MPKNNKEKKTPREIMKTVVGGVLLAGSVGVEAKTTYYNGKENPLENIESRQNEEVKLETGGRGSIDFDKAVLGLDAYKNISNLKLELPENVQEDKVGGIMKNNINNFLQQRDLLLRNSQNSQEKLAIEKQSEEKIKKYVIYATAKHFIPGFLRKNPYNESIKMNIVEVKIGNNITMFVSEYNNSYESNMEKPNEAIIGVEKKYGVLKIDGLEAGGLVGVALNKQIDSNGTRVPIPVVAATIKYTAEITKDVKVSFRVNYTPSVEVGGEKTPEITAGGINFTADF